MKKLLIIDDDDQLRAFLTEALTDEGFDVVSASDGNEGLNCIAEENPDLVITDIVMPEKEGVEVIMALKNNHSAIPVIAISGGNLGNANSYLKMAKKLGADVVLTKPFKLDELTIEIDKLLK